MEPPLLVDMDKVPPLPLAVRSGSSAPPTGRSGSSGGATPRTGGANTARSNDGKGTPRDCERIPLGTRPRGEVPRLAAGALQLAAPTPPVPGSPMTTARSGAGSTPSSQGALSSRSRSDSLYQDASLVAQATAGGESGGFLRPAWMSDLSREIEVMRHVICQENVRLREQVSQERAIVAEVARALDARDGASASVGSRGNAPVRRRTVEWLLRGVDGVRGAKEGHRVCNSFELLEWHGISFRLSFGGHPRRGAAAVEEEKPAAATVEDAWPCQLRLRARGPGCAGVLLRVALQAELQRAPGGILGGAEAAALEGGGQVACDCAWPDAAEADVLCRAEIAIGGYISGWAAPLHLGDEAAANPGGEPPGPD